MVGTDITVLKGSDECIDLKMKCVFFFYISVYFITCRNNASI